MTSEELEELKGLAASMGLYDDKNPCKRAVILGKAIKALEQEPKSEWTHDHEILRAYADGADNVLEKIRSEIQSLRNCSCSCSDGIIEDVEDIIDKHISKK